MNIVSAANEIYVNTTGNDTSGNGSVENPYLTIQKGVDSVDPNGTIYLANGIYKGINNTNITLNKNMSIIGQSHAGTLINGENISWIFKILNSANITISNLTLSNGYVVGSGGAIQNRGNLTVTACTFNNNFASLDGGAIWNYCNINDTSSSLGSQILNLNDCIFSANTAGQNGGAISNQCIINIIGANNAAFAASALNINHCTFTENTAGENGGSISNQCLINVTGANSSFFNFGACVLNINHCIFKENAAIGNGGAISNNCIINVTSENTGDFDFGACVLNINDCTLTFNSASVNGGAISNQCIINFHGSNFVACVLNVNRSTLTNNSANRDGGAIWNNGTGNIHLNRIVFNTASHGNAIYSNNAMNVTDNWWGSNYNPKSNPHTFGGSLNLINADPWLILTINASPTIINFGGSSKVTASVTINSKGIDTSSMGHIPDGIPITITTDLGNVGSKSVIVSTVGGKANTILKANDGWGIAHIYAILDGFMTPEPATVIISSHQSTKTVGMQKTGIPISGLVIAILMIICELAASKRK